MLLLLFLLLLLTINIVIIIIIIVIIIIIIIFFYNLWEEEIYKISVWIMMVQDQTPSTGAAKINIWYAWSGLWGLQSSFSYSDIPHTHSASEVKWSVCIYINTMAECRSGRKCIAVKWNISDISRVFAWRREISPTDVKYHLTTWNITYQREKSDIAPPL